MLKKILNGKSTSITSAAIIIGGASLASRLLGVIRDRVLASQFGVGDVLDAYYAAFRVPDTLFNLIVLGALSAGFIPIFSDLIEEHEEKAWKFANNVLAILTISLLVVCAALFIATPWMMPYVAPGFTGEKLEMTIMLTRIMFASPLLLGISSLFGGILQSLKRFLVYSLAPIVYNLGIIFGALVFVPLWGVIGLAYGVVLGALLHLLIQLPSARILGFSFQPIWNPSDKNFRHLLKIMGPRTLSLAVTQVNFVVITIIATMLAAGSLTIFNFAMNIQSFPLGIFGISFAIAAFPTLCELARRADLSEFTLSFSNTVRQILFFMIPMAALFIVLRAQIVRVILGGGLFDWPATIATADALAIFAISLPAQALIPLVVRGFFALKDSLTPFVVAVLAVALNVWLAFVLTQPFTFMGYPIEMGVGGLALAYTAGMLFQLLVLWIVLRVKVGSLRESVMLVSLAKIITATVAMVVVTQFMKFGVASFFGTETFGAVFAQGFISGVVGLGIFVLVGIVINMEELTTLLASLKRKLFKQKEFLGEEGIDVTVD